MPVTVIRRNEAIQAAQLHLQDRPDDEAHLKMVHNLFTTFDLDGGGDIDAREMRVMLSAIFHESPRSAIAAAMKEVATFAGADEELDFGSFSVRRITTKLRSLP